MSQWHGGGCLIFSNVPPRYFLIGVQRYEWLDDRSRMSREVHVRFWESAGVRLSCATQLPL